MCDDRQPGGDKLEKLERISRAGAHLMGRVSYQQMSSYWPRSDDEYAAPMDGLVEAVSFPSGVVVHVYRRQHG